MNVFRILGDVSHTLSKCILIWAIHSNKSAEGVSLITQALYILVFITRYTDLFYVPPLTSGLSLWNFVLKIFYITSSVHIIFIMMRVYARTREREKAWKLGAYCLGGSLVLAPIVAAVVLQKHITFTEVVWTFSIILESVCIVPQLLLLRQTTVPTVIDSGYILTLGSYRAFYILNWIVRWASEHHLERTAALFGIIQTAFYVDFAWVYYTRQRVKLRGGGLVDSDDLSRGFLVKRVLGKAAPPDDEQVIDGPSGAAENGNLGPKPNGNGRWGARGISVSADDTLEQAQRPGKDNKASYNDARDVNDDEGPHMLSEDEEDAFSGLARDSKHHLDGQV